MALLLHFCCVFSYLSTAHGQALDHARGYAGCWRGHLIHQTPGWTRLAGDSEACAFSTDLRGILSCAQTCEAAGYHYYGFECGRANAVCCQCASKMTGTRESDEACLQCPSSGAEACKECPGPYQVYNGSFTYYVLAPGSMVTAYKVSQPPRAVSTTLESCNEHYCTSPNGYGRHDCIAGSDDEPCTCRRGKAQTTGQMYRHGNGKMYYFYCCRTDGTGQGEECGDFKHDPLGAIVGMIILILCCCGGGAGAGIGVFCCYKQECCCFARRYPPPAPVVNAGGVGQPVTGIAQPVTGTIVGQPAAPVTVYGTVVPATVVQPVTAATVVQPVTAATVVQPGETNPNFSR